MYEVRREEYTTVIREMIRHENEVTNHRTTWLLVGQGFIANAFVAVQRTRGSIYSILAIAGILLAISAFVMLYKSYQARCYLQFLGQQAKLGLLKEEDLPVVGWPRKRIENWRDGFFASSWIDWAGKMMEPWMFLPSLFMLMWVSVLLIQWTNLGMAAGVVLAAILSAGILFSCCRALLWSQSENNKTEGGSFL